MNTLSLASSLYHLISGIVLSSRRPCNIAAFHLGRSGSRLLGDLLNQHPNVMWDGELMTPARLDGIASRWPLLTRDRMKILKRRMLMAGRRCYGFETQPTQVDSLEITFEEYVGRLDALKFSHFVVLERKNQLRRIVSIMSGHHSAKWHLKSSDSPSLVRFELNVDRLSLDWGSDTEQRSLISHLHRAQENASELKRVLSNRRLLCLTYEDDLAAQPSAGYRRVCDFAGIDDHPVSVRFGKTNPFDLKEVLTNFSQVERALAGSPFEWMLYS